MVRRNGEITSGPSDIIETRQLATALGLKEVVRA